MNFGRAIVLSVAAVGCSLVAVAVPPGVSPGPGIRYATDAYPGFDSEDELLKPSRKEPGWFGWISGPKKDTAAEQLAYAASLEAEESWKDAKKAYDALVREWPTSPEAPKAQKAIADICLGKLLDSEAAFAEYRYLLDFYSAQCNYDEIVELMYKTAELMRDEGKTIVFFRFDNTVDVRRAYEAVVLRAPGASFAPKAMLTIASLREDEDKQEEAKDLTPVKTEEKPGFWRTVWNGVTFVPRWIGRKVKESPASAAIGMVAGAAVGYGTKAAIGHFAKKGHGGDFIPAETPDIEIPDSEESYSSVSSYGDTEE